MPSCARRIPHGTLLKLFAVPFSKTSAALPPPLLLIVPPQAISRIRHRSPCCREPLRGHTPAHRAASRRFAGLPLRCFLQCHRAHSVHSAVSRPFVVLRPGRRAYGTDPRFITCGFEQGWPSFFIYMALIRGRLDAQKQKFGSICNFFAIGNCCKLLQSRIETQTRR